MKIKTTLALGGGGVRGFAHIGVLKVFEKESFPVDSIVGTSIGAIIGAGFALYKDVGKLEEFVSSAINREEIKEIEKFFTQSSSSEDRTVLNRFSETIKSIARLRKKWIFEADKMRNVIKLFIPEDVDFSDLKLPFACVTADIFSGERIILKEGNLLNAVLASSSIPGVFPPQKLGNRFLVDGGIISKLPVEEAKIFKSGFVLGVNVESFEHSKELKDGIDITLRVNHIMSHWLNTYNVGRADFVISPDLQGLGWALFSKGLFCIKQGEEAAGSVAGELKRAWRRKKFRRYFNILPFCRPVEPDLYGGVPKRTNGPHSK